MHCTVHSGTGLLGGALQAGASPHPPIMRSYGMQRLSRASVSTAVLLVICLGAPGAFGASGRFAYATIHYEGTPNDAHYILGVRVLLQSLKPLRHPFLILASREYSGVVGRSSRRLSLCCPPVLLVQCPRVPLLGDQLVGVRRRSRSCAFEDESLVLLLKCHDSACCCLTAGALLYAC